MGKKRKHRNPHREEHLVYGYAGYGWGTPGWTAQQCLQSDQFGNIPAGEMTTTTTAPASGDAGGAATGGGTT